MRMVEQHNLILGLALSLCMVLGPWISIEAAPQASLITQLPGFNGTFPSKHYSGYAIHYLKEKKKKIHDYEIHHNLPKRVPK